MKTKLISAITLSFIWIVSNGQPVIQNGNNMPAFGSSGDFYVGNSYQGPGSSGANQVWDFSSDTVIKAGTFSMLNPANTPFAATFPTATHCNYIDSTGGFVGSGIYSGYHYSIVTADEFGLLSWNYNSSADSCNIFEIPYVQMWFPFIFEDSLTLSDYSICSGSFTHIVHYDGYGTLITPLGNTYENVVRVKIIAADDSEQYYFYSSDPLRLIYTNIPDYNYMCQLYGEIVTDIPKLKSEETKFKVYPNPASKSFTISIDEKYNLSDGELTIINNLGQQNRRIAINNHITVINTEGLTKGIYYCRIQIDGRLIGITKVAIE